MTDWNGVDVDAGDVTIHVHRAGSRARPPVVFAHGFTDDGRCWSRVVEAFGDRYDMAMVDSRNHGRSGTAVGGVAAQARDLAAVITALGLDRPTVIGHSMGASAGAVLAAERPELVSRLVLEDPPWLAGTNPSDEVRQRRIDELQAYVAAVRAMSGDELVELGRSQHGDWDEADLVVWREAKRQLRTEAGLGVALGDWRPVVAGLGCPTLLVRGEPERGGMVTPKVAIEAASLNPRLVSRPVSGAGHNIRREHLAGFLDVVRTFLDGG
ncbi:MAG: alpha/beta hydrolase [Actinomycetota bacterium]